MSPSWKTYLISSTVIAGVVRLAFLLVRTQSPSYRTIDDINHDPSREARESGNSRVQMAAIFDGGLEGTPFDPDRVEGSRARDDLNARLIQIAHEATLHDARELAKVAFEADDAVLHADCPRIDARIRALQDLARGTEQEDEAMLLSRRVRLACP